MMDITVHFAPNTCARVPMIALEEIGTPYKTELVAFVRGDHVSPRYLALNPKGKVPVLIVDGRPLTENVAILTWLADQFPEARLLPRHPNSFDSARVLADLAFCATTLHGLVTRLRIPQFFCDMPDAIPRVFEMAEQAMRPNFALIEARLAESLWWYGNQWSIVDAYINWIWFRVAGTDFDISSYPHFTRHDERHGERPAVQRALSRHVEAAEWLAEQGLEVKFGGKGAIKATAA